MFWEASTGSIPEDLADQVRLKSVVPGRQRWEADALQDQPKIADLIEGILRRQPDIFLAVANPLTGRILVQFNGALTATEVSRLVKDAVIEAVRSAADDSSPCFHTMPNAKPHKQIESVWALIGGGALAAYLFTGVAAAPLLTGAAVVAVAVAGWSLWKRQIAPIAPLGRAHPLIRLKPYYERHTSEIITAFLLSIFYKVVDIAPPLLIGAVVDVITNGQSILFTALGISISASAQLWILGGMITAVFILESVLEYKVEMRWRKLAQKFQHELRLEAWTHVQHLELAYFEDQTAGALSTILNDDINQLELFLSQGINSLVQQVANIVLVSAIFFIVAPSLAWVALLPIPVILWTSSYFQERIEKLYDGIRKQVAGINSQLVTNINGIAAIKSFTTEDYETDRIRRRSEAYLKDNLNVITLISAFTPWIRMAVLFGFGGTIVLGGSMVISGTLSAGAFALLIFLTQRLLWPLTTLGSTVEAYQRAMASATRVLDLLDQPSGPMTGDIVLPCSSVHGELRFEDVSFSYHPDRPVLTNLSFEISAHQTTAIVGATGSGKTTIIKLLLRFYDVSSGRILLDGRDLRDINVRDLRNCIGLVSQDGFLFDGSVRENITYGSPNADPERVIEAAALVEAHNFIQELPQKYDTLIGDRGVKLSGGQRQRICMARTILKNPPILILDEATSAVDNETEAAIQQSLARISIGRTTIIIAHRLATVRNAERIYVLGKTGSIIEQGRHEELLCQNGFYEWLWRVQTGSAFSEEWNCSD
jgi:ATP-binding cassette subfamily B protein